MRVSSIVARALIIAAILAVPALGYAQTATAPPPIAQWKIPTIDQPAVARATAARRFKSSPPVAPRANVKKGVARAAAGVAGGFAGFWLGGIAGAKIEGKGCRCDDPGLQGFIIGAPIGAVAGAVIGIASVK